MRLVMAMKIATLARGHSGVRVELVERMIEMFNRDLLPVVPSQGSVGASGDLTPLSHVAVAMIGVGHFRVGGEILQAGDAPSKAG